MFGAKWFIDTAQVSLEGIECFLSFSRQNFEAYIWLCKQACVYFFEWAFVCNLLKTYLSN